MDVCLNRRGRWIGASCVEGAFVILEQRDPEGFADHIESAIVEWDDLESEEVEEGGPPRELTIKAMAEHIRNYCFGGEMGQLNEIRELQKKKK